MTEKQLKKLSRLELIQMLILATQRNQALAEENEQLKEQLAKRELICQESGSIAMAALQINKVFEACQQACDDYLKNVQASVSLNESSNDRSIPDSDQAIEADEKDSSSESISHQPDDSIPAAPNGVQTEPVQPQEAESNPESGEPTNKARTQTKKIWKTEALKKWAFKKKTEKTSTPDQEKLDQETAEAKAEPVEEARPQQITQAEESPTENQEEKSDPANLVECTDSAEEAILEMAEKAEEVKAEEEDAETESLTGMQDLNTVPDIDPNEEKDV